MASTVTVENERGCLYGVCDETVSYVPLVTLSSKTTRTPVKRQITHRGEVIEYVPNNDLCQ